MNALLGFGQLFGFTREDARQGLDFRLPGVVVVRHGDNVPLLLLDLCRHRLLKRRRLFLV